MSLCDECQQLDLHQFARPQNALWVSARHLVNVRDAALHHGCKFCTLLYNDIEDLIPEISLPISDLCLMLKFHHYPPHVQGINKLRVEIEPTPGMQGLNAAEWVPQRYHEYNVMADSSPSHWYILMFIARC